MEDALTVLERKKFLLILQALAIPDEHHGIYWNSYYGTNQDLLDLEQRALRQCSKIAFIESKTNVVTDDDKFCMRSDKSGQNGWIQSEGKNYNGDCSYFPHVTCRMPVRVPLMLLK